MGKPCTYLTAAAWSSRLRFHRHAIQICSGVAEERDPVWMGAVYNFWRLHAILQGTPAKAADFTDHVWSIDELLRFRIKRE